MEDVDGAFPAARQHGCLGYVGERTIQLCDDLHAFNEQDDQLHKQHDDTTVNVHLIPHASSTFVGAGHKNPTTLD